MTAASASVILNFHVDESLCNKEFIGSGIMKIYSRYLNNSNDICSSPYAQTSYVFYAIDLSASKTRGRRRTSARLIMSRTIVTIQRIRILVSDVWELDEGL